MEFSITFFTMVFVLFIMAVFKFRSFSDIFKFMFVSCLVTGIVFFLLTIFLLLVEIIIEEYTYLYFEDYKKNIEIFISIISFLPMVISLSSTPFYLAGKELTFWEEFQLTHYKKIRGNVKNKEKTEIKEEIKEERKKFYIKGTYF